MEKALQKIQSSGIKLNANHRRDLVELIEEISVRDNLRSDEVIDSPEVIAILEEIGANGPQKLKHIKKALFARRYRSRSGAAPISAYKGEPPAGIYVRDRLKKIFVESPVANEPVTRHILERFKDVPVEVIKDARAARGDSQDELVIAGQSGRFLKKCPGTPVYQCCDYYVLNLGVGCFSNCHYCYLHHYMNTPFTVYANLDDMFVEVREFCAKRPNKTIRLGSGEFIDSVGIDDIADLNRILVPALTGIENIIFEIKTKSSSIDHLLGLNHHDRAVIAWSVNSEKMIAWEEPQADSLADRLKAAAKCRANGYKIGFHFDPLIHYEGWEEEYERVVDKIFEAIEPEDIAWISLGALRFNPALKPIIKRKFPESRLIYGELLPGLDGKLRYPLSLRREMFRRLNEAIKSHGGAVPVYLCMENKDLAEEVGAIPGFTLPAPAR